MTKQRTANSGLARFFFRMRDTKKLEAKRYVQSYRKILIDN